MLMTLHWLSHWSVSHCVCCQTQRQSYSLQQWWPVHKHFAIIHPLRSKTKYTGKKTYSSLSHLQQHMIRQMYLLNSENRKFSSFFSHLDFFVAFPLIVGWNSVKVLSRMSLSWSWTCSMIFTLAFYRRTHAEEDSNFLNFQCLFVHITFYVCVASHIMHTFNITLSWIMFFFLNE